MEPSRKDSTCSETSDGEYHLSTSTSSLATSFDSDTTPCTDVDFEQESFDRSKAPDCPSKTAKQTVIEAAIQERVITFESQINDDDYDGKLEETFFVADLGEIYRQHVRWKEMLPRIEPHFAVKSNPDPRVLRLLARLGAGFDCASKTEIKQILESGVQPKRIIYAQPCKAQAHLRYAAKHGVAQMTFDNTDELYKIKELCPTAELFLRILTDDSSSLCRLSQKFGASLDHTEELLHLAKCLDLKVVGVAFHVGSGASNASAFHQAVRDARFVFDQAGKIGFNLHTLDCGGGFSTETFDDMAPVLAQAVNEYFPPNIRIIAEPGRYYTSSAFTLASNVIARRTVKEKDQDEASYMLYMNDGVYGNFSSIIFDHQHPVPQIVNTRRSSRCNDATKTDAIDDKPVAYSIWGPTCDGIDCIAEHWSSTSTVEIGDWLYFEDMGAYTKCSATEFNGFSNSHDTVYVSSEPAATDLIDP